MSRLAVSLLLIAALVRAAAAGPYDPPSFYYNSATGVGSALKNQLHNIIDNHSDVGYNGLRTALQVTDADPDNPGHILLVYDRTSLDVSNLGDDIPGWDFGVSWNREHLWPRSRGVESSGPDNSDLFNHRPSDPGINQDRGNDNFGGAYGQPFGEVSDGGTKWYPGDPDAGMVARAMFYMEVRYDGSDSSTIDLELETGNPGGSGLGDLNRMIEWHFAAPPDDFERRRNQIIYNDYQHNRNPFIDHPEYAWSVFVDQANDSRITVAGAAAGADGGSSLTVDLGRVYVGGQSPNSLPVTLSKSGFDGAYYEVTTSGAATSTKSGPLNAFRTNQTDTAVMTVGLNANSSTPGVVSGQVRVDNLDITTGGGAGRGANDADDVIDLTYTVLEHPVASFAEGSILTNLTIDLGEATLGSPVDQDFSLFNYAGPGGPSFASLLELDSVTPSGDVGRFGLSFDAFTPLLQGDQELFNASLAADEVGDFSANYVLAFSGEDLPGDQTQLLMLTLTGAVTPDVLLGDFNNDQRVDAADYAVWRVARGTAATLNDAGVNDGVVDQLDYLLWRKHFGETATSLSAPAVAAPEPSALLASLLLATLLGITLPRARAQGLPA